MFTPLLSAGEEESRRQQEEELKSKKFAPHQMKQARRQFKKVTESTQPKSHKVVADKVCKMLVNMAHDQQSWLPFGK
jgi:hypothetical protein